jgi:hypothetical protein
LVNNHVIFNDANIKEIFKLNDDFKFMIPLPALCSKEMIHSFSSDNDLEHLFSNFHPKNDEFLESMKQEIETNHVAKKMIR